MTKGERRRQELLERLADHVLAHGLQGASLRPLAAAAGTSDRMLLHYFVDKEELLTATLQLVTRRLIILLEQARAEPLPFERLLPVLAAMLREAQIAPYIRLWFELIGLAAADQEPFRSIAREIARTFVVWIAAALELERADEREAIATLLLAILEGIALFDTLGDEALRSTALAGLALRLGEIRP